MIRATSKDNAKHYLWGEKCDGWHLLNSENLSVIEERMPPGSAEQRHFHLKAQQVFYVLSGELTLEANGDLVLLQAGQSLHIPPSVPHQATNRSSTDTCFLVVSQPPSHGDRQPAPV